MSARIHILVTIALTDEEKEAISTLSDRIRLHHYLPDQIISEEIWESAEILFTYQELPTAQQVPNLRWLQYYLAGVDKLKENPLFAERHIKVTTMSGVNATQVAEHALALILAWSRRLPDLINLQARGEWMPNRQQNYRPQELRESTVAIVGYGSVGRQLARLLHGFGGPVLALKKDAMQPEDQGYSLPGFGDPDGDYFTRLYPPQALNGMLSEADYVVAALPLTEATRAMIGPEQFAVMKPSAYLINVSRGGVVDEPALLEALEAGRIAGAALDVFMEEPLATDSPLWEVDNLILTPHIAGIAPQYNQRAVAFFIENVQRYIEGQPLYNETDLAKGY